MIVDNNGYLTTAIAVAAPQQRRPISAGYRVYRPTIDKITV